MLKKLFRSPNPEEYMPSEAEIRAEVDDRLSASASRIARRFTRGNVSIQQGAFINRDEIEAALRANGEHFLRRK